MVALTIEVSQSVWNFLNKKGEPTEVAKQIVESAWETDGRHSVKAIQTDCRTYKDTEVSLEYIIKPSTSDSSRKEFKLLGGPTGYETFYISDYAIEALSKDGWILCGNEVRDSLFIPAKEMRKAFVDAGLLR